MPLVANARQNTFGSNALVELSWHVGFTPDFGRTVATQELTLRAMSCREQVQQMARLFHHRRRCRKSIASSKPRRRERRPKPNAPGRFNLRFDILPNDKLEAARTGNWFLETNLVIARLRLMPDPSRTYALTAFCAAANTSRADVVPATCSVPVIPRSIHPALTLSNISSAGPVWPFGMPNCSNASAHPARGTAKAFTSSFRTSPNCPPLHPRLPSNPAR